ncbi:hypothetical protein SRHO_G00039190 [Serrasalmus rhombeus]
MDAPQSPAAVGLPAYKQIQVEDFHSCHIQDYIEMYQLYADVCQTVENRWFCISRLTRNGSWNLIIVLVEVSVRYLPTAALLR